MPAYDAACCYALSGDKDQAFQYLTTSLRLIQANAVRRRIVPIRGEVASRQRPGFSACGCPLEPAVDFSPAEPGKVLSKYQQRALRHGRTGPGRPERRKIRP